MFTLRPSRTFFDYLAMTKDILLGKKSKFECVFFWCIVWCLPFVILGWYFGDLLVENLEK